jgi:CARDB
MVRTALIALAASLAAAPAASADGPASAELVSCERAHRAAEFEAAMDAVPGAEQLAMRFTLEARKPGRRRYRRVHAPGFSEWTSSSPGTERYVFTRRVEALVGPARYRVLVRFRWLDANGDVIARARRRSGSCRQRDHRPNLKVMALQVAGGDYRVLVGNRGPSASGPFDLELTVDGEPLEPVAVDGLEPWEDRLVDLHGPECGTIVRAVADPLDLVDERVEDDNGMALSC